MLWREEPIDIDPTVPHSARVYDYLPGGVTNFEADRQAAVAAGAAVGGIEVARASVRSNRVFLGQVVRWLAGPAGIRQFLDIGTGIPNDDNVHAVALAVTPDPRVVYVDNDPIVLAHAHELLDATPPRHRLHPRGPAPAGDILRKAERRCWTWISPSRSCSTRSSTIPDATTRTRSSPG